MLLECSSEWQSHHESQGGVIPPLSFATFHRQCRHSHDATLCPRSISEDGLLKEATPCAATPCSSRSLLDTADARPHRTQQSVDYTRQRKQNSAVSYPHDDLLFTGPYGWPSYSIHKTYHMITQTHTKTFAQLGHRPHWE